MKLSKRTFVLKCVFLAVFLIESADAHAQHFVGLSANLGNRVHYTPSEKGFKVRPAVSGNLAYLHRETINDNWLLDTEIDAGVLGYNLYVVGVDTLYSGVKIGAPSYFYETLYTQISLSLGRNFKLLDRDFTGTLGGGLSYFYNIFTSAGYSISLGSYEVFDSRLSDQPSFLSGHGRASLQMKLDFRWILALGYMFNFTPAQTGRFEFYHTPEPISGNFKIFQREFRVSVYFALING